MRTEAAARATGVVYSSGVVYELSEALKGTTFANQKKSFGLHFVSSKKELAVIMFILAFCDLINQNPKQLGSFVVVGSFMGCLRL